MSMITLWYNTTTGRQSPGASHDTSIILSTIVLYCIYW